MLQLYPKTSKEGGMQMHHEVFSSNATALSKNVVYLVKLRSTRLISSKGHPCAKQCDHHVIKKRVQVLRLQHL